MFPQAHIQRILDLGRARLEGLEFESLDTDWQGEAYATVSGQNSNNSVRVPNSFMDAVKEGGEWNLYSELKEIRLLQGRDPVPCRTMDASDFGTK